MKKTAKSPAQTHFHGIGGAFYPEHHPEATWPEYADLLAEAGLSAVRIGEFAWDKMEPREGVYDFAWLDRFFALLEKRKLRVLLCTPTAVPPLWAVERYPEILPVMEDGRTLGFGKRRYTCLTSPAYRRLSEEVSAAMAAHYAKSPVVLAWQLDNEIGHPFCFCDRCLTLFREWCERRFGTVAAYNDALCLHFWGQTVTSFSQIQFPPPSQHPGLWNLYHAFMSDVTVDLYGTQADIIRALSPAPVTTNMMLTWYGYDHEALGRRLDETCGDHYGLRGSIFGDPYGDQAFVHAFLRSVKHGRNPWFAEFAWAGGLIPGLTRWGALTQVGLGTDLVSFFRFDEVPHGQERDGYGLVGLHRKPGRIYREVASFAKELARAKPILDGTTAPRAEIAVLFSYDNHVEFARNHHPRFFEGMSGNGYSIHLSRHFRAIVGKNIPCDIVQPGDDFGAYRVIVVPALFLVRAPLAEKLSRFAADGGTVVVTSFSGFADENGRILETPVPGPLGTLCGVEALDYQAPPPAAGPVSIVAAADSFLDGPIEPVLWFDEVTPAKDVRVLAEIKNRYYGGRPTVTKRRVGKGHAWYVGAVLDDAGYAKLYGALVAALGLKPVMALPEGLHATLRTDGKKRRIVSISNPGTEPREIRLDGRYVNILNGRTVEGTVTVKPLDVLFLKSR